MNEIIEPLSRGGKSCPFCFSNFNVLLHCNKEILRNQIVNQKRKVPFDPWVASSWYRYGVTGSVFIPLPTMTSHVGPNLPIIVEYVSKHGTHSSHI